jgi:mannose-6-phosphate isomerase-like protein (cupin superfamily)
MSLRHACVFVVLLLSACADAPPTRGRVVTVDRIGERIAWTPDELAKPIAVRRLHATAETSVSMIRLKDAEKPHIHQTHDLVVVMLSGGGVLHLGDRAIAVKPGDVMEIPRGTVHWAENTDAAGSEVYAVFSPPYDGMDNIPVLPFTVKP